MEAKTSKPKGEYAHENLPETRYTVDFDLKIGTPCCKEGTVTKVKDDSDQSGLEEKFADKVNYVQIKHNDGTYAEYLHLAKDSAVIKEGEKVKAGDMLAGTGWSGLMDSPHLHFNVLKKTAAL